MNNPWDTFPAPRNPLTPSKPTVPTLTGSCANAQSSRIAIVGAGLAGCWLGRILAEQGIAVTLYEKHSSVATAASGNPAGIVKPFVTRSPCLAMSFHCLAHRVLLERLRLFNLQAAAEFTGCGVLQLVTKPYAMSDSFTNLSAAQASTIAGLSLNSPALSFANAGWLNPKQLCESLVDHPLVSLEPERQIVGIHPCAAQSQPAQGTRPDPHTAPACRATKGGLAGETHQLAFQDGKSAYAEYVVLTTGAAQPLFPNPFHLPITAARGQISRFLLSAKTPPPKCVVSGRHYVIPQGQSLLVGATFHRDNIQSSITEHDHASNLEGLRQLMPTLTFDPRAVAGFAGVRATTPDRLPIVGPLPDFNAAQEMYRDIRHGRTLKNHPQLPCQAGIYMIGGLGSRGIVTAPLCAQLLADHLTRATGVSRLQHQVSPGVENSLPVVDYKTLDTWAPLINPARFLIRNLKRNL